MAQTEDNRIAQLENEENERKLIAEKIRLETLSDNLPEGTLYRFFYRLKTKYR